MGDQVNKQQDSDDMSELVTSATENEYLVNMIRRIGVGEFCNRFEQALSDELEEMGRDD